MSVVTVIAALAVTAETAVAMSMFFVDFIVVWLLFVWLLFVSDLTGSIHRG